MIKLKAEFGGTIDRKQYENEKPLFSIEEEFSEHLTEDQKQERLASLKDICYNLYKEHYNLVKEQSNGQNKGQNQSKGNTSTTDNGTKQKTKTGDALKFDKLQEQTKKEIVNQVYHFCTEHKWFNNRITEALSELFAKQVKECFDKEDAGKDIKY